MYTVILFSLIAMLPFTGLSGAWFPRESSGRTFATIGHLTPAVWAVDRYSDWPVGLGLR